MSRGNRKGLSQTAEPGPLGPGLHTLQSGTKACLPADQEEGLSEPRVEVWDEKICRLDENRHQGGGSTDGCQGDGRRVDG